MTRPPYNNARRVFWIVDNCSVHRGRRAVERLRQRYPRRPVVQLIHAPTHASWLNQVEIYFSIVQRKVLTPNDFPSLDVLAERLLDVQYYWETRAQPFDWKFTRQDLKELLDKIDRRKVLQAAIA
jgi:DDE superfamily endonuclease